MNWVRGGGIKSLGSRRGRDRRPPHSYNFFLAEKFWSKIAKWCKNPKPDNARKTADYRAFSGDAPGDFDASTRVRRGFLLVRDAKSARAAAAVSAHLKPTAGGTFSRSHTMQKLPRCRLVQQTLKQRRTRTRETASPLSKTAVEAFRALPGRC